MAKAEKPEKSDKTRRTSEKDGSRVKSKGTKTTKKASTPDGEKAAAEVSKSSKRESNHKEGLRKEDGKAAAGEGPPKGDARSSTAKAGSKSKAAPAKDRADAAAPQQDKAAEVMASPAKVAKSSSKHREPKKPAEDGRAPTSSAKYLPDADICLRSRSRSRRRRRKHSTSGGAAAAKPAAAPAAAEAKQPAATGAVASAKVAASRPDILDARSCSARSSDCSEDSGSEARRKVLQKRDEAGLRPASGFSALPSQFGPPQDAAASSLGVLAPLPEKIRGLLNSTDALSQDVAILKQAVEQNRSGAAKEEKPEEKETMIKMQPRLHESLLHPDNRPKLLALTGLESACLNQDGLVVLKAYTKKGLSKALGQLRRLAYHCQWGCNHAKVSALLAGKPAKPIHTMVVRLAATSSRLASHEARLTSKARKLRIGTQSGIGQFVIEGVPGLSRRHCTVTFEPDKGSVYVQDLSTNGTYLNSKRLPRPPFKNPTDARVRLFHGDELFFRLRTDDSEELGFIVNLYPLS